MNRAGWTIKKGYYRLHQQVMKVAAKLMKYPEQKMLIEEGGTCHIPEILEQQEVKCILLVCSKTVRRQGLLDGLFSELEKRHITYVIDEDVEPNTTTKNVEDGYQIYVENQCQGIVAIGGGSVLDCAKIIGIKASNPTLSFAKMKHMTAVRRRIPYTVCVPTTAGTGSESTIAAVVTDVVKKEKYAIISFKAMPQAVILDANLTRGLPAGITASTGMDALTHAIEAYIGISGTDYTDKEALQAIKMIFDNIEKVYKDGTDMVARRNMLVASNHAANAFTRAYTGYVHSISHALSALYNVGHGKTNAIVLPLVLRYYGESIEDKLAKVACYTGIGKAGETKKKLAKRVMDQIEKLNESMGIPHVVEELQKKDIPLIVSKALREGNPMYPVPRIINEEECTKLVEKLWKEDAKYS